VRQTARVDERVVRRAPLFQGVDDEAAAPLLAMVTEITLRRGEVLFRQGDSPSRLYVVDTGKIKLGRTAPDGRENLMAVLGPGEMFGELSWFDPGPRTSAAVAVSPSRLAALDYDDLYAWMAGRPEVAQQLLRALARRLRRTNAAMADLVFTDVPGRVAGTLLDLAQRFGKPVEQGVRVSHDLTQEELAQLVGASRETVNKALADFAARGWLRLEARSVVLLELDRLRRRAH
jgi:CRP/FNR family transcriptional regulator, cyclic AMP receptor protein